MNIVVPLLEKVAHQAEDTRAEPSLLGNPQLNLLEVSSQNVGGKVDNEAVGKGLELGFRSQSGGVSVASVQTVQALVCPALGLPPGVLLQLLQISGETFSRDGLLDHLNEKSSPRNQRGIVAKTLGEVDLDGVMVALEDNLEHLGGLHVIGADQSCSDLLNGGEEGRNNLVNGLTFSHLEPMVATSIG